MNKLITEQAYFRMPTLILNGSKEFKQQVDLFERIDEMLRIDGIEDHLKNQMLSEKINVMGEFISDIDQLKYQKKISKSLRTNIAHQICGGSFIDFSIRLADSNTLQWFCGYDDPCVKKIPGKSSLHSLSKLVPTELINKTGDYLMQKFSSNESSLMDKINISELYADSTCLKLNIHHPIDWVLLKDVMKSIMGSIKCLRRHGIRHRISPPDGFIKEANRITMDMTLSQSVRKDESKKKRKRLFRDLKTLLRLTEAHGRRYLAILHNHREKTDLSEAQAEQILQRMINVLDQIDDIVFQSNERIVGERKVQNKTKILSLFEKHAQVYKRGKSGSDIEFGLQLFVAETKEGLISNWKLRNGVPQHDSKFVKECIEDLESANIKPLVFTGDRGFYAKGIEKYLKKKSVDSHIFPKNKEEAVKKLQSQKFRNSSNRRSQTEGRIGILKNKFIG